MAGCAFCRRPHIGVYAVTSCRGDSADVKSWGRGTLALCQRCRDAETGIKWAGVGGTVECKSQGRRDVTIERAYHSIFSLMRWFLGGFPSSAAVLCFVAAAAFFATACDPSHGVTYENRMGSSTVVLINGRSEASLINRWRRRHLTSL